MGRLKEVCVELRQAVEDLIDLAKADRKHGHFQMDVYYETLERHCPAWRVVPWVVLDRLFFIPKRLWCAVVGHDIVETVLSYESGHTGWDCKRCGMGWSGYW